ncbi:retropepsin-like aspartic protease family protein [Gymnodinialimonas ceratoperidinii]|uniref:TIGR02281 family clan AA aspartic protease n=1 Tax=Gymnodinialimonas ceratoperidinii TaxID=2856823 RepID=A0A8F6TU73_9RHOB|nr:TIGR02281 family clan AA aspartic protease [Gymnodinialimonas ceratoperidinii]QXT38760.1 TIGR02281 family clan AA aspartic protease [Gymnodinialimonas ceratoperidinii]
METEDIPRLIYLIVLLCAVAGYFLWGQRGQLGKMARYLAVWGFIFLGAIVAVGLWTEISNQIAPRQSVMQSGAITVPRASDGHFYLTLEVNGVPTRFVVDTGASAIVLSLPDAVRAGIKTDDLIFSGRATTANGRVETAPTRVETLSLGGIVDENVRVIVNGGDMSGSLLGMTYLNRFSRLEIADGRLILER